MMPLRIGTIAKILCAMVVLTVMITTWVLYHHIVVSPLDGAVAKIIPEPSSAKQLERNNDLRQILVSETMPNIDPGERVFQTAYQLLEEEKYDAAQLKLASIFEVYPNSTAAATAKKIVGEMNLDRLLSTRNMSGKQIHTVKAGDSYLGIAAKYKTSIDCMMHLNSMLQLDGIQPGDRLIVMPLEFTIRIEPKKKVVSLWKDGQFIREYPAMAMRGVGSSKNTGSVESIVAEVDGTKILPHDERYPSANKIIQLSNPAVQIRSWDESLDELITGVFLRPNDLQEIALLTRSGNSVEFR